MPTLDFSNDSAVMVPNTNYLVYSALKKEIIHGLEPGSALPLKALSERFQVSTTPIRDALEMLIKDGLCAHRPRYGTVVAQMSVSDLRDIRDIRAGLETEAIRLAVGKFADRSVDNISRKWSGIEDDWHNNGIPSLDSYLSLTLSLRIDIYLQTSNAKLVDLIAHYALLAERYLRMAISGTEELYDDICRHRDFISAIVDRDSDGAVAAVRALLDWTVDRAAVVLNE